MDAEVTQCWQRRRIVGLRLVLAMGVLVACLLPASGFAASSGPMWTITSVSSPTNFVRGESAGLTIYTVTAINTGGSAAEGTVTLADTLPEGVSLHAGNISGVDVLSGNSLSCGTAPLECSFTGKMNPGDQLIVTIVVDVSGGLPEGASVLNVASVSGGGAPAASISQPTTISSSLAGFGVAPNSFLSVLSTVQAGDHPNFTTTFSFNESSLNAPSRNVRNIELDLPPGLIANPTAIPQCNMAAVEADTCPPDTAIGVAVATVVNNGSAAAAHNVVYNIAPYRNEPAAFAFNVLFPVRLDTSVRTDRNYEAHVSSENLTEGSGVAATAVTLWGVPADNNGPDAVTGLPFGARGGGARVPFLINPTSCGGVLSNEIAVESWPTRRQKGEAGEGELVPGVSAAVPPASMGPIAGCEKLSFSSSIQAVPDTTQAGAPSGYSVNLQIPQNENPDGLGTPNLKEAVVTLPQGTVISPSAADGLGACSETQIALHSPGAPSCPNNSRVGSAEAETPLLAHPLQGSVYLAAQGPGQVESHPSESQYRLYLVLEGSGVTVKLAGEAHADPVTGQLVTRFSNLPQLPVSAIKLHLNGGPRATLANPVTCGEAVTTALLTPYGAAAVGPSFAFPIGGCAGPRFGPSFTAGTTNNLAGQFSPFTVTMSRTDQDQDFGRIAVKTPPGLLGILKNVTLCPESQASVGACEEASLIGHTTVGAGPGPTPFYLGGKVYLTGPYNGAPFGLSIVVPAIAGPFNLGNVKVRAAISIDPNTSQLTITSDPLPTILDGIPLQVKTITVSVDRSEFTFNPTSCDPMAIEGTLASTEGAAASVSSRYQAASCGGLTFAPKFSASSLAKTSRANGAALDVKVGYPSGAQANIHSVAVSLPKQLPSRLTTLQKACTVAQFNTNPAGCPAASVVGHAKAITPVLPVPLQGPAYFVSHGNEAFPQLVLVLQGYGVTIDLVGDTFINKAGITSSTFKTVPDAPVSSFELTLPQGPFSALAANGNLCKSKLAMPTTITAQNGAQIKQSTRVAVKGCPASRAKTKKKKAKKARAPHRHPKHNVTPATTRHGRSK